MHALKNRFVELLSTRVDGASLAMFRIFLGVEVVLTACSLLVPSSASEADYAVGVANHFSMPPAHWFFPYHGFEWVRPWPEPGMTTHCLVLLLAGSFVALGLYYRVAIVVAFLARTYIFLLDESIYNNHYYLECLLLFLLAWMPAAQVFSLDRWRHSRQTSSRRQPASDVPFWSIFLLRAQLFLVYFFGGVTKLQTQYLLDGEPMKTLLRDPGVWAPYEALLPAAFMQPIRELASRAETAYFLGYCGLLYDLLIGFLLVFRRTRALGIVLTLIFHGLNHFLFFDDIGWFPLLGVLSATIFLEPDWPRRFWHAVRERRLPRPEWRWLIGGAILLPGVGAALGWWSAPTPRVAPKRHELIGSVAFAMIVAWVAFQALWPLRHYAIAGDVNWTNEGERFSWRMKSNLKLTRSPVFRVEDARVLGRDAQGAWQIDWQALGTPVTVYHDVAPAAIDWRAMPELFIEYSPFVGERLIYNARHDLPADRPAPTLEESRSRIGSLWQQAFQRPVAGDPLVVPRTLAELLNGWDKQLTADRVPVHLSDAGRYAQIRAAEVEDATPGAPDYDGKLQSLQLALSILLVEPEYGRQLRALLRDSVPLATSGAKSVPAGIYVIDDAALAQTDDKGVMRLDRAKLAPLGAAAQHVFAELERNAHWEWSSLPRTLVYADPQGNYQLLWNQHADLLRLQDSMMQVRPYMIHQYANRIAELWEQEQGRRPRVFVTNYVALVPRPPQLLIDPQADLAAVPLRLFGHNEWILPLDAPRPRP
ncbi:MAG: HTTM domain-containing protein [Pirellulales bacterium]|nr:HTTM domain-containing protein [Pirellulales bacterium]